MNLGEKKVRTSEESASSTITNNTGNAILARNEYDSGLSVSNRTIVLCKVNYLLNLSQIVGLGS